MTPSRIIRHGTYDRARIKHSVDGFLGEQADLLEPLLSAGEDGLAVVKPNWLSPSHQHHVDEWRSVIANPVVVLAVVEVLAERMRGRGSIAVCDAPTTQADFDAIVARGNFRAEFERLSARFPRMRLEILDLRREIWLAREEVIVDRRRNVEDPRGYSALDLATDSLFYGHRGEGRYFGADYDADVVNEHHRGQSHEYLLSGTAIRSHLFINVPKLKTHRKTGLTCCLKNLVGINGDKNWLPHHTQGYPHNGGDEFTDARPTFQLERWAKRAGQKLAVALPGLGPWLYRKARNTGKTVLGDSRTVIRNGNWSGNDTCWRMVLDLNRALLYGNPDGTWRGGEAAKPYIAIVDGIVAGEGMGPSAPDPVDAGVLVMGTNPGDVDAVACRLMGYDPSVLPMVREAFGPHRWPISADTLNGVTVLDERCGREVGLSEVEPAVPGGFAPHFGWVDLLRPDSKSLTNE